MVRKRQSTASINFDLEKNKLFPELFINSGELQHSEHTGWAGDLVPPYFFLNFGLFSNKET